MGDRRSYEREPLTLKVEYPEAGDLLHDYTENISRGGTFILTQRELPVGVAVRIELSFPGLLEPIQLHGAVRWTRAGGADEQGVGVEFDFAEPGAMDRLAQVMVRIERGDPQVVARTLRVLIVEDNTHVADLLRDGIGASAGREYGGRVRFQFEHVKDGRQALERVRAGGADLVIVDIYLPVMDGPSFIRALRADPELAPIPVIAVSAGGASARDLAAQAGADLFVEKPMRLREILETVKKLMAL